MTAAKPPQPVRRPVSSLEPLEGRIAPATLISATTVSYQDLDGDTVTVKFSKAIFDLTSPTLATAQANAIFSFTGGSGVDGSNSSPQALNLLDLTKAPFKSGANVAAGVSFTISAETASGSGSTVDVGRINAAGLALGSVRVDGALAEIDCGSNAVAVGLKSLTLGSFTSAAGGEKSVIVGGLGSLKVLGDFSQAHLQVINGSSLLGKVTAIGKIGSVDIDGSLVGKVGATIVDGTTYANWGLIDAAAGIGSVKIGSNASHGIKGGLGANSGAIVSGTDIGSVTISGSVVGGFGTNSGSIQALGKIGSVKLIILQGAEGGGSGVITGGTLQSATLVHIYGGTGIGSGGILTVGNLTSVKVGGTVSGGFIESQANIGAIEIGGTLHAGSGASTGRISAGGSISSLEVGSLVGGSEANSGSVFTGTNPFSAGNIGSVKVAAGLYGGAGANSGSIITSQGNIGSIKVGSDSVGSSGLNGGVGSFSGAIFAEGTVGKVKITGNLIGSSGADSASLHSFGKLASINVSGNVIGGAGEGSAAIFSHDQIGSGSAGNIGSVTISIVFGLSENGGAGAAQIHAEGSLGKARIGALVGGSGAKSGSIIVGDGAISSGSGAIRLNLFDATAAGGAGTIEVHGRLASLAVKGAVRSATIHVGEDLGAFSAGTLSDTIITAGGQAEQGRTADVAIGKITISGNVENSQILAGFSIAGNAVNADAQIGAVKVGGSWSASDLVAGAVDFDDDGFGNADDRKAPGADNAAIVSRIASITIAGVVSGTPDTVSADDHFGFVAQEIGSFKAAGTARSLTKNFTDQPVQLATDVALREIPLTATI
jgi:hypothetical protein